MDAQTQDTNHPANPKHPRHDSNRDNRPSRLGKLDLMTVDTVLVKFSFTNRDHIPAGIPEMPRLSDNEMDGKHQIEAIDAGLVKPGEGGGIAKVGRHRDGRVDTGEPIAQNVQTAYPAVILHGLPENGLLLRDVHWYKHDRGDDKRPKFVVVCAFERGQPGMAVSIGLAAALTRLAHEALWHCHIWKNPSKTESGMPEATVNFVVRQPRYGFEGGERVQKARAIHSIFVDSLGYLVADTIGGN
jgi:hypothetical protein